MILYRPIDDIVDGIVIEVKTVDIPAIKNIYCPIILRPEVIITWLRDGHLENTNCPKHFNSNSIILLCTKCSYIKKT